MRDYDCYISFYFNGKLQASEGNACWSMLYNPKYFHTSLPYCWNPLDKKFHWTGQDGYISKYDDYVTRQYQELLLNIINQITPCKFEMVMLTKYIKYKMLDTYPKNLILLNFIRNLWHDPGYSYVNLFFKALEASNIADPITRLLTANKEACRTIPYEPGHSNVFSKEKLVIRSKKEFMSYKGTTAQAFLTGYI